MLFFLKFTRSLYNSLAGAMTPTQLAFGLSLGFFLGMMPFHWTRLSDWTHVGVLVGLVLVTKASWGLFGITAAATKPLMLAGGDALANWIGHGLLDTPSAAMKWILGLPGIALAGFDDTLVLGGFIMAAVCAAAFFFPIRQGIIYFREKIQPHAEQYAVVRWWRGFFLTRALSYIFVGGGNPTSTP